MYNLIPIHYFEKSCLFYEYDFCLYNFFNYKKVKNLLIIPK